MANGWGVADAPLEHAPEAYRVAIYDGVVAEADDRGVGGGGDVYGGAADRGLWGAAGWVWVHGGAGERGAWGRGTRRRAFAA